MAKNMTNETPSINLLGPGTTVKGDIQSDGDFRIDGSLTGSIKCTGKVVIGVTGKVEGEIHCGDLDISGKVDGKVSVGELLSLKSTARLKGDVITSKLSIEPGAVFSGKCTMDGQSAPVPKAVRDDPPKAEKTV
ncbi:MAG TPA: polymer-forming cytoskeletal protein [Bacteroidales bacterium]|nr:polymer-forming cytoskeletal protein [Bacteroidales bacterium]HRZ75792.1 polymer-forming cytoskeletal protein [Bacteroidales bacterium]